MTTKKGKKAKLYVTLGIFLALVAAFVVFAVISFSSARVSYEMGVAEAQAIVDETLEKLPKSSAQGALSVGERTVVTVKDVSYGDEKDVILSCEYETVDIHSAFEKKHVDVLEDAYALYMKLNEEKGRKVDATTLRLEIQKGTLMTEIADAAEPVTGEITLYLYEVKKGEFELFLSDEVVNTCFGGILDLSAFIDTLVEVEYQGEVIDIKNTATLRTAIKDGYNLINYESLKPDTGNFLVKAWNSFQNDFDRNFIEEGRWIYLVKGLGTTLAITGLAGILGLLLGFVVAIIRCTYQMTGKMGALDKVCGAYLTVIRGTPVMVQLLIIYFVILLPLEVPKFISAVLCFGLNSGAYVAEIVRGGIMAIDKGQMEAGRSLGFGYTQSMVHFIMPQAFKAVLPSLANEFITLLKESSVAFYIGVADLTQGGLKIRSVTYSTFMPLLAVALIYLAIVLILTKLVGILERRLRKSER